METFSAVLALCARNSPVTGGFSSQRPVRRGFDISLDLRLNKRLSKQSWGWWLKTTSHSLSSSCLNNSRKLFQNNHSLTFCGMVFHAYTMLFRPICTSYFHVPNCVLILQSTIAIFFIIVVLLFHPWPKINATSDNTLNEDGPGRTLWPFTSLISGPDNGRSHLELMNVNEKDNIIPAIYPTTGDMDKYIKIHRWVQVTPGRIPYIQSPTGSVIPDRSVPQKW